MSPYVISLGASIAQAGIASAAVMVGMCVGKVALGAVCDHSPAAGVACGCGAGAVGCLALAAASGPELAPLCAACFLFGIAYASSSLLGAVLTRHGFGPRDFDHVWPTVGMFIALGNAFGAWAWGALTETAGFTCALLLDATLMACALALGLTFLHASKRVRARWDKRG